MAQPVSMNSAERNTAALNARSSLAKGRWITKDGRMHSIFRCSKCGYQISWDNAKESEPVCSRCSPQTLNQPARGTEAIAGGSIADWWRRTEEAWGGGDLRSATRYLLEILRRDPGLNQIAWKNLVNASRVDMSGVPEHLLAEVRAVVNSVGPRAVDSWQAREKRLRLVTEIMGYVQPGA
jgi:endogenous inhibitor of DNA gyrase (YacG/DUF329 family)